LEVPAGWHRVELEYQDSPFQLGALIALATLLGGAIAWFKLGVLRQEAAIQAAKSKSHTS
jgi:hypothetical protein